MKESSEDVFEKAWAAISKYGITRLAVDLGLCESALWKWHLRRRVPRKHFISVESMTGARREWMDPDLFGDFRRKRK